MDRLRIGLLLLAAAPVAWLAAALLLGTGQYVVPLAVTIVGVALVAWAFPAHRRVWTIVGLLAGALGLGLFYDFHFLSSLPERAGGVVLLGLVVAAAGLMADAPRGLAAGLVVVAIGSAIWIRTDWGVWEWQAGNVLAVVGAGLAAVEIWRKG